MTLETITSWFLPNEMYDMIHSITLRCTSRFLNIRLNLGFLFVKKYICIFIKDIVKNKRVQLEKL